MSSKRRAPRPNRRPEPAPPPRRRPPRGLLWVVAAAVVVGALVLIPMLFPEGRTPPEPTPPDWPEITVDGAHLPIYVAATRAQRERLVPLQVESDRSLARFFHRYSAPVGVLFAYPVPIYGTVHLDAAKRDGDVTILFLTDNGGVDSVWPVGNQEFRALARSRIRFTLFVPGAWFEAHRIAAGGQIALPPAAAAAAERAEVENPPITDPPPAQIRVGGVPLTVEVAARREPRSRGLMFREYLADGKGMIFLFPRASAQKFWMRNTRIPLDIAYIGEDYRIRNIKTMRAHDLDRGQKYGSAGPVIIALETPADWFRKNGVRKGALLEVTDELKALQQKADP